MATNPNVRRREGQRPVQRLSFGCLRVWMIDFEDGDPAQARQAIGPGVEPRTKDDELLYVLSNGGRDRIVDEPGACDHGGTYSRPPVVDEPRHELPKAGYDREPGHECERPRQEGSSKMVLEESSVLGKCRLERTEKRVLFRSATWAPFPHEVIAPVSKSCRVTPR
jgi:hypothetical protein